MAAGPDPAGTGNTIEGGVFTAPVLQAARMTEPVLVVADNASSDAQVRPLLPGAAGHKVLVTSRHTLAGLGARLIDVTVLDDVASAGLLDQALRAARPEDDRITASPQSAARLVEVCGGLPLALQITAALLTADPALSAAELAEQLEDEDARLEQLRYDDGSEPSGPSVAAAFALSYTRLDRTSGRVFALLPVAPGPDFSAETAAVLVGMPAGEMRRVLSGLARAHLIEPAPGPAGRSRMHDLVRLYAQRLEDEPAGNGGREQALDRLLDYWLAKTDAADDHLRALPGMPVPEVFTGRQDALAWLDSERASLSAAVGVAAAAGRDQAAMMLPILLAEYLNWRRQFDDMVAITTIAAEAARRLGDPAGEALALTCLGNALHKVRRIEEAITAHQDAATIYRDTGDQSGEGIVLANLGVSLSEVGRFEEAITAHQDAAAIYRETGDRHGEGMTLNNLGNALDEAGRVEDAITAFQQGVAICQEIGDRRGEGMALNNLGLALREVGRFEEAITAHQDAAAIYRETGDRHGEGMALNNLGLALRVERRFEEAITVIQEAVVIFRETGDQYSKAKADRNLELAVASRRAYLPHGD